MKEKPRFPAVWWAKTERRICGKKRVINKIEVGKADVQVDESEGRLRGRKEKKRAHGAWTKKRVGRGTNASPCCLSVSSHLI